MENNANVLPWPKPLLLFQRKDGMPLDDYHQRLFEMLNIAVSNPSLTPADIKSLLDFYTQRYLDPIIKKDNDNAD